MRAWCDDATMLEQSESVPGSCNIRYGASTEKLDEIGLMRMPCHAVEVVIPLCAVRPPASVRSRKFDAAGEHSTNTEHHMMRCYHAVNHASMQQPQVDRREPSVGDLCCSHI